MNKKNYDYIIIGTGIGGLITGAILARQGKKVLLLEKHSMVGGYASYFRRGEFTFDVSLHQIGGVKKTVVKQILEKAGVYNSLEFIKPKEIHTSHFRGTDFKISLPNGDIKKLREKFLKHFPHEKKGIDTWLWWVGNLGRQLVWWDYRHSNVVRRVLTEFTAPLFCPLVVFSSLLRYSITLRHIKDPLAYKVLNQLTGYYGLPAKEINMQFPAAANYGYYFDGGYYIRGGGFQLSKLLQKVIESGGGEIRLNTEVEQFHTFKNKIVGVGAQTKENFFGKHFISNANPISTYSYFSNNKYADEKKKKLEGFTKSMSCSVLYIGLKKTIEELNPAMKDEYEIFINSNINEEEFYKQAESSMDFKDDYKNTQLVITMHSNIDRSFTPKNKSMLNVFLTDNCKRWGQLSRAEYKAQKEKEVEKILKNILEPYFPKIREAIEVIEFATPLTMKKFTNNPDGAIYGFSQHLKQAGPKRGNLVSLNKFRNLHFTSAWGFPGGGYEGSMRGALVICQNLQRSYRYWITWGILAISIVGCRVITIIG